jgi:hypothetical protein
MYHIMFAVIKSHLSGKFRAELTCRLTWLNDFEDTISEASQLLFSTPPHCSLVHHSLSGLSWCLRFVAPPPLFQLRQPKTKSTIDPNACKSNLFVVIIFP